jgi:hypothetical protein
MNARPKQSVAQELRDDLLRFVEQKFYAGEAVEFQKDTNRLLGWVILWPAGWFIGKGVTVPGPRYKQILCDILLDAVRFGNTSKVSYRPAWLKSVVQRHFACNGEKYYEEAKKTRTLAEHVLLTCGASRRGPDAVSDPVRELAAAVSLLNRSNAATRARLKSPETARQKTASNLEFNL